MIVDVKRGNIFEAPQRHIAFAVNTSGLNDAGFAGQVSRLWPELADTGGNEMGEVLTREVGGKVFHALVCHSLYASWDDVPDCVTACLDKIDAPEVAVVLIGDGLVGRVGGADVYAILGGMARSRKRVVVYTREARQ